MLEQETLIRRSPRQAPRFSGFRRHTRKKISIDVVVKDDSGLKIPLKSADVSASGIFLQSPVLFDIGEEHEMEIRDGKGKVICVKGRVTRLEGEQRSSRRTPRRRESGMGYEFVETDDYTRSQIISLVQMDSQHF